MGRDAPDNQKARAASYFMARAEEAIAAADSARSDEAMAALYREAEAWLYMAGKCLNPEAARPPPADVQLAPRAQRERRSFSRDD